MMTFLKALKPFIFIFLNNIRVTSVTNVTNVTSDNTDRTLPLWFNQGHNQPVTSRGIEPEDSVIKAAMSIIQREKWQRMSIFYDQFHAKMADMFVTELSRDGNDVKQRYYMAETTNTSVIKDDLLTMLRHHQAFVLMCSEDIAVHLIKQLRQGELALVGPHYFWMALDDSDYNMTTLEKHLFDGDNFIILKPSDADEENLEDCETMQYLRKSGIESAELSDSINSTQVVSVNSLNPFTLDRKNRPMFVHVGYWIEGLHLWRALFPIKEGGFWNRTFRVATLPYGQFVVRQPNGTYTGICKTLLDELSRALNFSYTLEEPPDQEWGARNSTGHLTGMIGQLERKEIDLVMGPVTVTHDRSAVVDFTAPFMVDTTIIVMKKPGLASQKIFICLGPFSLLVWILLIASVLVAGFISWMMSKYSPVNTWQDLVGPLSNPWFHMWQVFGALLQQSMVILPTAGSGRILAGFWWCFVIIIVNVYTGNLTAFLSAPQIEVPVNDLHELAASSMVYGCQSGTALHDIIKTAEGEVYQDLRRKVDPWDPAYFKPTLRECLELVLQNEDYALLLDEITYHSLYLRHSKLISDDCELVRSEETFFPQTYAFPMQKDSPYTDIFSITVMWILEAGLLARELHVASADWKSGGCTGLERRMEQQNISLIEAQGAFYILGIGLIIGAVILMTEFIIKRRKRRAQELSTTNGICQNGHVTTNVQGRICRIPSVSSSHLNNQQQPIDSIKTKRLSEPEHIIANATNRADIFVSDKDYFTWRSIRNDDPREKSIKVRQNKNLSKKKHNSFKQETEET